MESLSYVNLRLDDQQIDEGLVDTGMSLKSKTASEKMGLLIYALKGHLTPEIKAIVTGRTTNKNLVLIPREMTSQLQVLDAVMK